MTPDLAAGMALAATVLGDRDGAEVASTLDVELRGAFLEALHQLRDAPRSERERMLGSVASQLRPAVPADAQLPARVAALLASEVPRDIGHAWSVRASEPRRGFRLQASLRAALRRLAADAPRHELEGAERRRGRALLWAITVGDDALRADMWTRLEPTEASALTSEGALIQARGDGAHVVDKQWVLALLDVARAFADPNETTRALGAMDLGATEGGRGRWRRAGVEAARVWRSACRA